RTRVVELHESGGQSHGREHILAKHLGEEPPVVAEDVGLDEEDIGNRRWLDGDVHQAACVKAGWRRATISRPIASEAVAPGLGAFKRCSAPGCSANRKSSTNDPFGRMACARTPAPPGARSPARMSGTSRDNFRANNRRLPERQSSSAQTFGYLAINRQSPGYANAARPSGMSKARTAFGPASIPPSMCRVKCTPRKGKAGSGTG